LHAPALLFECCLLSSRKLFEATLRFTLSIARHARRTTPFVDTRGATDMSLEMPKPGDVLSFELPPLQKATEDLLKGHTFSIRVRITEVK